MFDRFHALSIRQQVLLVAALACAGCVFLIAVWFFALRTNYQPLFSDLRPADAATIVAELEHKKIDYRLENGGGTILVPAGLVDATRLDVMTQDLPLKGTVGFELFNKSDVGLTDFAQKINYQRALQGELERTIMSLDGIESARVHLSLGEDRIFRDDRVPPKASVMVRMQKGAVLAANAAQGVQKLIAASVPNLDVSDVVIVDESGRVIGAPAHVDAAIGTGSPEAEEKAAIEQYYKALIRRTLDRAYPQFSFAVGVAATTSASDSAEPLPEWNPAARIFPLIVTLSAPAALDAASQEGVRNLVSGIVRSSAATTDTVQFAIDSVEPSTPVQRIGTHPPETRPTIPQVLAASDEDGRDEWRATAVLFAVLVAAFLGVIIMIFRTRSPKRLDDQQRARVAEQLRAALAQGDSHAFES
ncbi:MAG: flagellar basal-body MS-ring/collar protein FliF [Rhizomicrobium sp.]